MLGSGTFWQAYPNKPSLTAFPDSQLTGLFTHNRTFPDPRFNRNIDIHADRSTELHWTFIVTLLVIMWHSHIGRCFCLTPWYGRSKREAQTEVVSLRHAKRLCQRYFKLISSYFPNLFKSCKIKDIKLCMFVAI